MSSEKIKLIIVDDEEMIREGLCKGFPWGEWGYEVSGSAHNGEAALALINQCEPDVVITDIRMPRMDGIELIDRINSMDLDCHVIIVSGYSDIEYYKTAIEYKVFDYLLKPTGDKDVKRVMHKLKDKLIRDRAEKKKIEEMKDLLDESIPIMKRNFLTNLIDGEVQNLKTIQQKMYFFDYRFSLDNYSICRLSYESDEVFEKQDMFFEEHRYATDQYVLSFLNRYMKDYLQAVFFSNTRQELYGICFTGDTKKVKRLMAEAATALLEKKRVYLMCGVSSGSGDMTKMQNQQDQANQAHLNLMIKEDSDIEIFSMNDDKADPYFRKEVNIKLILSEYLASDGEKSVDEIENFFDYYMSAGQADVVYIDMICDLIFSEVVRAGVRYGIIENEDICHEFRQKLSSLTRLTSKKDLLYQSMGDIKKIILQKRSQKESLTIEIEGYIYQHLNDHGLSLTMIGEGLNRNPTYLSALYKKQTGVNILDFITEARMKQAKEYLQETTMKSYEIAEKIGYGDASYFTKIFRRTVGMSPTEYRKKAVI